MQIWTAANKTTPPQGCRYCFVGNTRILTRNGNAKTREQQATLLSSLVAGCLVKVKCLSVEARHCRAGSLVRIEGWRVRPCAWTQDSSICLCNSLNVKVTSL